LAGIGVAWRRQTSTTDIHGYNPCRPVVDTV